MSQVRKSSFRHVFGTAFKPEHCFRDLSPKTSAWDTDYVKCNGRYFAIPWNSGGGSIAVMRLNDPGKKKPSHPILSGHQAQILDFEFHPFNDNILASCSADNTVKVWSIPDGGLKDNIKDSAQTLIVDKKMHGMKFHNTANNILCSWTGDGLLQFWDIEKGKDNFNTQLAQGPNCVSFNMDGSLMCSVAKDRKLRITDPRQKKQVQEAECHQGIKGARTVWMKKLDKIFTVGTSKIAERQCFMYDPKKLDKPIVSNEIDTASSILMPFYDEDNQILFLAGKGESNIRYYEINMNEDPYLFLISIFKAATPTVGMGMLPKYALDVMSCETTRLMKLDSNSVVPIMFQVPRRSPLFQPDIYPDTFSFEYSATADEWLQGKNAGPKLIPMHPEKNPYKSGTVKISDFNPVVTEKPVEKLPEKPKTPKEMEKQNNEFREKLTALEKENKELKDKLDKALAEIETLKKEPKAEEKKEEKKEEPKLEEPKKEEPKLEEPKVEEKKEGEEKK